MSITAETAKEHAKDPAVLCCRAEGGITIQSANLEDPAIFDDLVDSNRYLEQSLLRPAILLHHLQLILLKAQKHLQQRKHRLKKQKKK